MGRSLCRDLWIEGAPEAGGQGIKCIHAKRSSLGESRGGQEFEKKEWEIEDFLK